MALSTNHNAPHYAIFSCHFPPLRSKHSKRPHLYNSNYNFTLFSTSTLLLAAFTTTSTSREPRALICTMFTSTDYTPVTYFIFYGSGRGLHCLVPFKGLFRCRIHSRITCPWNLANIWHRSACATVPCWILACASLWQCLTQLMAGIQEPTQSHYTYGKSGFEGGD